MQAESAKGGGASRCSLDRAVGSFASPPTALCSCAPLPRNTPVTPHCAARAGLHPLHPACILRQPPTAAAQLCLSHCPPARALSSAPCGSVMASALWSRYLRLLDTRPILTKSITSATLYLAGDALAQKVDGTLDRDGYDVKRGRTALIWGQRILAATPRAQSSGALASGSESHSLCCCFLWSAGVTLWPLRRRDLCSGRSRVVQPCFVQVVSGLEPACRRWQVGPGPERVGRSFLGGVHDVQRPADGPLLGGQQVQHAGQPVGGDESQLGRVARHSARQLQINSTSAASTFYQRCNHRVELFPGCQSKRNQRNSDSNSDSRRQECRRCGRADSGEQELQPAQHQQQPTDVRSALFGRPSSRSLYNAQLQLSRPKEAGRSPHIGSILCTRRRASGVRRKQY